VGVDVAKNDSENELVEALRRVHGGELGFSPDAQKCLRRLGLRLAEDATGGRPNCFDRLLRARYSAIRAAAFAEKNGGS
jgi:hypothetical protein